MLDHAALKDLLSKSGDACREATSGRSPPGDVGHVLPSGRTARVCGIGRARRMMARCGRGCANWRSSAGGSAIDGCTSRRSASVSGRRRPSPSSPTTSPRSSPNQDRPRTRKRVRPLGRGGARRLDGRGFGGRRGGHRARLAGAARRHGRRHVGGSARPRSPSGAGLAAGGRRAHHPRTARPRLPACRSRSFRPGAKAARSPAASPAESPSGRRLSRQWPRTRRGSGRSCDATGSRSRPSRSSPTPASTTGATRCARSRRWCTCRRRQTTAAT